MSSKSSQKYDKFEIEMLDKAGYCVEDIND